MSYVPSLRYTLPCTQWNLHSIALRWRSQLTEYAVCMMVRMLSVLLKLQATGCDGRGAPGLLDGELAEMMVDFVSWMRCAA